MKYSRHHLSSNINDEKLGQILDEDNNNTHRFELDTRKAISSLLFYLFISIVLINLLVVRWFLQEGMYKYFLIFFLFMTFSFLIHLIINRLIFKPLLILGNGFLILRERNRILYLNQEDLQSVKKLKNGYYKFVLSSDKSINLNIRDLKLRHYERAIKVFEDCFVVS